MPERGDINLHISCIPSVTVLQCTKPKSPESKLTLWPGNCVYIGHAYTLRSRDNMTYLRRVGQNNIIDFIIHNTKSVHRQPCDEHNLSKFVHLSPTCDRKNYWPSSWQHHRFRLTSTYPYLQLDSNPNHPFANTCIPKNKVLASASLQRCAVVIEQDHATYTRWYMLCIHAFPKMSAASLDIIHDLWMQDPTSHPSCTCTTCPNVGANPVTPPFLPTTDATLQQRNRLYVSLRRPSGDDVSSPVLTCIFICLKAWQVAIVDVHGAVCTYHQFSADISLASHTVHEDVSEHCALMRVYIPSNNPSLCSV
jgi:hypothetical protein